MAHAPIPLTELDTDEEGAVSELGGGRTLVSRLATLGFTPGAPLKMVQNFGNGPLIVRVRDTRIALGRGEANKVFVLKRENHA
jgi:ferrous iron transport protein A